MTVTLSTKGQLVLPAAARRRLRLSPGERLDVELRDDGVFLRPFNRTAEYDVETDALTGLPRMIARLKGRRKVTAAEIARLHAELL